MNKKEIYPRKLESGDIVRVVAPSRSMGIISEETKAIANQRFDELGLTLTFGDHVDEKDDFASSSVASRIEDLHRAFSDPSVAAIIAVIGGFNSNQLLQYLDWELLEKNPKIFCGYSDITALSNALFAKTGLVSYSGPHYSSFGQKLHFGYTLEHFEKCLLGNSPIEVKPSEEWSDDAWYIDQEDRHLEKNAGWQVINEGKATGTLLGANLNTFNLLHGTEFMPSLEDSVPFFEDDELSFPANFDRDLQSVIHQPGFSGVRGLVIGRFQKASEMAPELLRQIIQSKKELQTMPVIANVDFGHTDPKITFPIGGKVEIDTADGASIVLLEH